MKSCTCGRSYKAKEWKTLPYVGCFIVNVDSDVLEMRNCPTCGSTISIPLEQDLGREKGVLIEKISKNEEFMEIFPSLQNTTRHERRLLVYKAIQSEPEVNVHELFKVLRNSRECMHVDLRASVAVKLHQFLKKVCELHERELLQRGKTLVPPWYRRRTSPGRGGG